MDLDSLMVNVRACLNAADKNDKGDDLSKSEYHEAMIGYSLRHVAESVRPYVETTRSAMDVLSKYRAAL